jgi:hypothetical protein
MTSKVRSADAIKLTKNENIIIYQYKIPERVLTRNAASQARTQRAAGFYQIPPRAAPRLPFDTIARQA